MKLASGTMMKLMAYADGELSGSERKEIEALLAKEEDAKKIVTQMTALGAVVQAVHRARPEPTIDIAGAVMARVKDEKPDPVSPASKVVSLEARRAQRTKILGAALAVMAVAASIVFFSRPKETPLAQLPPAPPPVTAPTEPGVVVEPIDSPGQTVKVIYGPGTNEMQTSVIIWVDEERK
jgi:anti-sigma factor RsiW